ncbi:MAG: hypothetical protein GY804_00165 [Alphaproteobacteria bacterium]|nr:hypothetical protein [Alphaproteobacteria bacterium]
MMKFTKSRFIALAAIPSLLASGSAFAAPIVGVPECTTALDFFVGCQVNVAGPTNTSTLTAELILPVGEPDPTTEAEALATLDELAITVDGLNPGDAITVGSQDIADALTISVIKVDYDHDMTQLGTVQDISAGFQYVIQTIDGLRGPNANATAVLGYSLGGIVSRYTLATMEAAAIDHNVGLYVSYETPHKGIYIPQALQNIPTMFEYTNGVAQNVVNAMNAGPVKVSVSVLGVEINQQAVDTRQAYIDNFLGATFDSAIIKQILMDNVHATTEFDTFFAEYDALGLPTTTERNIAITNGNLDGLGQPAWSLDGGKFYDFHGRVGSATLVNDGDAYADAKFRLYPTIAGQPNIYAGMVGVRYDWFFGGAIKNYAAIGTAKDYVTPVNAKEYDTVAGGWLPLNPNGLLTAANDQFEALSTTLINRHEPTTERFSFVPVYSSLDIDHAYDYSAVVDKSYSTFASADIYSMSGEFAPEVNGGHADFRLSLAVGAIIADKVSQPRPIPFPLTLDEKVVLWISDVDSATSCIDCIDDSEFMDIVDCDLNNFFGCLSAAGRGSDAEYFADDLYNHAKDTGFATIVNMYDALYAPDPTFTTAEIVDEFRLHVEGFDDSYWSNFTKAICEDQDTYTQHQSICDQLP